MTLKLQALIVGEHSQLIMATAGLLSRSGFYVDVASTNYLLKHLNVIRNFFYTKHPKVLVIDANRIAADNYDFIVIADDPTLKNILDSNLSVDEKLNLLPVIAEHNLKHIGSKTELSLIFSESEIRTPDFMIAMNKKELLSSVERIGFPMIIKIDFSGGGAGVFECFNTDDLISVHNKISLYPLLVQKKIEGATADLSGLFRNGALIYFSYSKFGEVNKNKFGPSVTREYKSAYELHSELFDELSKIGHALGANGFVNIGCIESSTDNHRYYFEADMRPTVWVEYPKYFQDDPALKINHYFKNGELLPRSGSEQFIHKTILLPYLPRMHWLGIIRNQYKCWQYFNNYMGFHFIQILINDRLKSNMNNAVTHIQFNTGNFIKVKTVNYIKPYLSKSTWALLKKIINVKVRGGNQ